MFCVFYFFIFYFFIFYFLFEFTFVLFSLFEMFCVFNFFIYNLQWKRQTQDDCVACPLLVQLDENACDRDALAPLNMLSMCPLLGGWTRATDEGDG